MNYVSQENLDNIVKGMSDRLSLITQPIKDWTTATLYKIGNLVIHDNILYKCLVDHTSTVFASDLSSGYWVAIGASSSGNGIQEWQSGQSYNVDDIIIKDDWIYKCISNHTSTTFLSDIDNWQLLNALKDWQPSTQYYIGQLLTYNHKLYRVINSFMSGILFNDIYLELIGGDGGSSTSNLIQKNETNVVAPQSVECTITRTSDFCLPPVEVLKASAGDVNKELNIYSFNSVDANNFNIGGVVASSNKFVTFNGVAKLKTEIIYDMGFPVVCESGYVSVSEEINTNDYKNIEGMVVI